ncbi:LysE family translocator [Streptomyces californicus]|uniref:LysE family translocator n=1 Tax=Streptomyces californicus TaxID=67351 RepID=A0ABD7D4M0_9ACTN|nr:MULTISPECIES: LysE family translocator [Streptomyces]MYW79817.1 LysE family transporter [Streptomyces sp. SID8369]QRV26420.1 LysE family translocator [Streptomyces californicus]QRV37916.1 LysE family translocator [Streptomyces californicus]QRV39823.1 LysE family translocator [Streptomyces californicus]QRV46572.1 LysE family translocator [Streptomyces californicus]
MDAQLIAFTGVAAGMVALPGADFTVVVRNALASRTAGLATALGVAGGLLVHTALAVAGLAAVLVTLPVLFRTVQLLGGAYVLYLGISALYALRRRSGQSEEGTADDGAGRPAPREFGRALRQGFLTNALNPKAPVLFLSLLPQFVPHGQPPLPRTLLLAAVVVVLALIWFPAVALLVDRLGRWLRRPRTARVVEGGSGVALTGLGLALVTGPLLR